MELELELEADLSLQALSMEVVSVEEWNEIPKSGTRILTVETLLSAGMNSNSGVVPRASLVRKRDALSYPWRIGRTSGVG